MAAATIGQVQSQSYQANTRNGFGFVVTGPRGEVLFSVTYPDQQSAEQAREEMIRALDAAVDVFKA